MPRRDLSFAEQANVRTYLRMLRVRLGGNWRNVERALSMSHSMLSEVITERAEVSATLAFRVAKILDVSLHHVLTGTALPPGTCRHCSGRARSEAALNSISKYFCLVTNALKAAVRTLLSCCKLARQEEPRDDPLGTNT